MRNKKGRLGPIALPVHEWPPLKSGPPNPFLQLFLALAVEGLVSAFSGRIPGRDQCPLSFRQAARPGERFRFPNP